METLKDELDKFKEERERMVREQLIPRGIKDKRLIAAMLKVPREMFVSEELKSKAYEDQPLPIGYGQTISQPFMVALMTQYLEVKKNHKVLEVGTGSGYQTAILAELCEMVYSIEKIKELAESAKSRLLKYYKNVKIFVGNGTLGIPEYSPYDRIIITAAAPYIPPPIKAQLKEGGILVIPQGDKYLQTLLIVKKKKGDKFEVKEGGGCVFVPLIGKYGFSNND
jgi:protein-L-isoaspartate(D-aspartate) O-methyltransferase